MDTRQACMILNVSLPIAEGALKSAFKRKSFETHPDRNGSDEEFIAVKEAYDFLSSCVDMILKNETKEKLYTVDGILLSSLGMGLPITKSGVKCESCMGKGYNEQQGGSYNWKMCPHCDGKFKLYEFPCKKCGGDGKFKRNGEVVGKCFQCNGTGKFIPKFPVTCKHCNPLNRNGEFGRKLAELSIYNPLSYHSIMFVWKARGLRGFVPAFNRSYHVCSKCKGTGEVELFNPVLRCNRLG